MSSKKRMPTLLCDYGAGDENDHRKNRIKTASQYL